MFTAIMTLCFVLSEQCMIVRDNRGPYETQLRCEQRLDEMILYLRKAEDVPKFRIEHRGCLTSQKDTEGDTA